MPIAPAAQLPGVLGQSSCDGLQAASKGGQIGAPDYFLQVFEGRR